MKHINQLSQNPLVGEIYLVDCLISGSQELPVLGPPHTDEEFGVSERHFHLDQRFLSDHQLDLMSGIYKHDGNYEIVVSPKTCFREEQKYQYYLPKMFEKMSYSKAIWDKNRHAWLCPHKGTYLGNVISHKGGCLRCPMHGLVVKNATGKVSYKY